MRELAALRLSNMRGPFYPGAEGALAFHLKMLEEAAERGELLRLDDRAFVLHWVEESHPHRHLLLVHRRESDADALAWCQRTLDAVVPTLGDDLEISLTGREVALRSQLLAMGGLGINSVVLAGRVEHGLRNLGPVPELPVGLHLRRQRPQDVEGLLDLRIQAFRSEPAYFWFGASEAIIEQARAKILEPPDTELGWVFETEGRIVGHFEYSNRTPCVHHGTSAGVGLVFDPSLRGRGLSRLAYRTMLESMTEHDIRWFKGTTARKPVLHLARRMGRGVIGVVIRRTHTFPPGWFGLEGT